MILATELLRTFVEVIETGSMRQAAERVHVTPSAVSLQIKRLEEMTNSALFFRDRRRLVPTPSGELLQGYARQILSLGQEALELLAGERATGPIRVGMVEDFARTLLAGALRRFAGLNPEAQLQLRVSGSKELREQIAANRLDMALTFAVDGGDDVVVSRAVHWFGHQDLATLPVLPLALLEEPCLFRAQATTALKLAGRRFEVAIETASVSALQAAVEAGLGITTRTAGFIAGADADRIGTLDLPKLPRIGYALLQPPNKSRSAMLLRSILISALDDL